MRLTTAASDACELANPYFQAQLSQPALDPVGAFLEGVFLVLVSLSGMLEPDGGMPGKKHEMRGVNWLAALLSFYKHGNTSTSGTFRMHVEKLLQFLRPERLQRLKSRKRVLRVAGWS